MDFTTAIHPTANFCCKAYTKSASAPAKTLASVAITGENSLQSGKTAQFTCKAKYSDNSDADVTSNAGTRWSIASGSAYASVSSTGLVTAKSVTQQQTVKVHADYTEGGITKSDDWSFYVTVQPPEPPTDLIASQGTDASCVRVTWTAPSGASSYSVYRSTTTSSANAQYQNTVTVPRYNDNDAEPGVKYTYFVKAKNDSGLSAYSAGAQGWKALSAPEGVTASDGTSLSAVEISWTAAPGAKYYCVCRAEELDGEKTMLGPWQTDTSYRDTTATPVGKVYYYYVASAVDSRGNMASDFSIFDDGYIGVPVTLDFIVINGAASIPSGGSATYTCTATMTDMNTKNVSPTWSVTAGSSYVTRSGATLTAKTVTANQSVTLQASYTEGDVTRTTNKVVTITAVKPAAPATVTLTGAMANGISISWSAVAAAASYNIWRSVSGGSAEKIGSATTTSYTDDRAQPGVSCTYTVSAVNAAGESARSSASATGLVPLAAPTGVTASNGTFTDKVALSWAAVTGATHYRVFRATPQTGAKTALGSWQTGTTYNDTSATPGAAYWYFVQAATSSSGANPSAFSVGVQGLRKETVTLVSLTINGPDRMPSGRTETFSCTANYSNGSSKPATPAWSASAGSITSGGAYTAPTVTANQTVTITARFTDGTQVTGTKQVTVVAPIIAGAQVTRVVATPRWPWNALLDIDYDLETTPSGTRASVSVSGYDHDHEVPLAATTLTGDGANGALVAAGSHRITWNLGADYPNFHAKNLTVNMTAVPSAVAAPANVTASTTSTTGVDLSWDAVEDAENYEIWRGTTPATNSAQMVGAVTNSAQQVGTVTTVEYSDTTATAGTDYYYWVLAVQGEEHSAWGTPVSGRRAYAPTTVTFAEAVDSTNLVFTTGGAANWTVDTMVSYMGGSSVKSGVIGDSQSSWIKTTVTGPGRISFRWKASCENPFDKATFAVDGTNKAQTSSTNGWFLVEQEVTGAGSHELTWTYAKDASMSSGSDCVWLDAVTFVESGSSLPSNFDLRTVGRVTPVKSIGNYPTGWAFDAVAALESAMKTSSGVDYDLSENNLINLAGFDYGFNDGGAFNMAAAYLLRWDGPVLESQDPYPSIGTSVRHSPAFHVQNIIDIPGKRSALDHEHVKRAIIERGGVYATFNFEYSYYNAANRSYRLPSVQSASYNTTGVIVGWDDSYPRTKFLVPPTGDGAYIVRMSYGSSWGENGYMYVSYYDALFATATMHVVQGESASRYTRNYQYDPLGHTASMGCSYGANMFTAADTESLAAVGVYVLGTNAVYDIKVRVGCAADSPLSGQLAFSQTVRFEYGGFYTVPFTTPVPVTAGERFSVVVSMSVPGCDYPMAIEYAVEGFSSGATAAAGQSFYSSNGVTWSDLTGLAATANFCCKVYAEGGSPVPPAPAQTLAAAVDNADLALTTGGGANWTIDTSVSYAGGSSAKSGAIGDEQTSWLQATITGPGPFSFRWKASCEEGYDILMWTLDGVEQGRISGETDWALVTKELTAGSHTIRWTYQKDESDGNGSDCGWVDAIVTPLLPPTNVSAGDGTVTASVKITWTATTDATSYTIWRGESNDSTQATQIGTATTTSYTDTTGEPGKVYYYWVKATDGSRTSVFSASDAGYRALAAPTSVAAGDNTLACGVRITWDAVEGADSYAIYRGTSSASSSATQVGTSRGSAYVDLEVASGTTSYYFIKATRGSVSSAFSAYDKGTRKAGEPTYVVLDLSGGTTAGNYPICEELTSVPSGGWTDEYKTTKLVLRRIANGSFTMGSPSGEVGRSNNEEQHQVTISKPFYMGVFEVTQKQYELVTGFKPSYFSNVSCYAMRPVEQVSYDMIRGSSVGAQWPSAETVDATSFMGKICARTGLVFDLPTEAQWEYACRAGTMTALNSGKNQTSTSSDSSMNEVGRYGYNSGYYPNSSYSSSSDLTAGTAAVGSYKANAWGLYDMHGNVWEWCLDWYQSSLGTSAVADPKGAASGSNRVLRGGGWDRRTNLCRSAFRDYYGPSYSNSNFGFRLCYSAGQATDQVTVSFDANGGSGTMATVTTGKGGSFAIPRVTFTRTGYTFQGWTTSSSGSVVYADGATIPSVTANMTLYAKWVKPTYNLTPLRSLLTNLEAFTPDGVLADDELADAMINPTLADLDGDASRISDEEMAIFVKIQEFNVDKQLITNVIRGNYVMISESQLQALAELSERIKRLTDAN